MRLLITLICLPVIHSLWGQASPLPCDTLVLKDGRQMVVFIDSVRGSKVYFRACPPEGRDAQFAGMRGLKAIMRAPLSPPVKGLSNPKPVKDPYWSFRSSTGRRVKVPKGRHVKVTINDNGVSSKIKGRLVALDQQSLTLQLADGRDTVVAGSVITRLDVLHPKATGLSVWGFLGIITAIAFFIMLLQAIYRAAGFLVLTGGSVDVGLGGCMIVFIPLLAGLVMILLALPKYIKKPFSDRWQIEAFPKESHPGPSGDERGLERP